MKRYKYKKVNAFTGKLSRGNPAAFLMLGDEKLTEQEFLGIGKEHAGFVSEVVFYSDSERTDYKLTYYSSECEVDFCGHGTIAAMYELIKNDEALMSKNEITIETNKKGNLIVYNNISLEDAIYITAPKARPLQITIDKKQIAQLKTKGDSVLFGGKATLCIDGEYIL